MTPADDIFTGLARGKADGSLISIYGDSGQGLERKKKQLYTLLTSYQSEFPDAENVRVARAPGRVNLIGEHTDYNGYPVLPIAIDRDLLLAFSTLDRASVEICNMAPGYGKRGFSARLPLEPYEQGDWGNYVKAAVAGLLQEGALPPDGIGGMRGFLSGDIPESAGLSSSSALVVVSAIALLASQGMMMDPLALAELLARAEQFTGSEGGGMDQAVALLGQTGKALKIDFFPLRVKPVELPAGFRLVVCHSLVFASKTGEARSKYNLRVAECGLAVELLRRALSSRMPRDFHPRRLSEFEKEKGVGTGDDRLALARHALGPNPLSLRSIGSRLGLSPEEVLRRYCTMRDGTVLQVPPEGLKIWKRFRHVLSEARRVEEAVSALEHGDVPRFADLMNASHQSCRTDYEISCPQVDRLVEVARAHGAWGSRLTGAGFGGCTVSLVPDGKIRQFLSGVAEDYYRLYTGDRSAAAAAMFPVRAVHGAGLLTH
jgi:N-acetylgalactosamine kinase